EYGAPTHLGKLHMIDFADFIVINKFEQRGSEAALSQVRKQCERSHLLCHEHQEESPVFGSIASQFNYVGTNALFAAIINKLNESYGWDAPIAYEGDKTSEKQNMIITNERRHYLLEIATHVRNYHKNVENQSEVARKLFQLHGAKQAVQDEQ